MKPTNIKQNYEYQIYTFKIKTRNCKFMKNHINTFTHNRDNNVYTQWI